jgi:hypothetical protein
MTDTTTALPVPGKGADVIPSSSLEQVREFIRAIQGGLHVERI